MTKKKKVKAVGWVSLSHPRAFRMMGDKDVVYVFLTKENAYQFCFENDGSTIQKVRIEEA